MSYRGEVTRAPLARVEGRELHVPPDTVLPKCCIACGATKKLRQREEVVEWRPKAAMLLVVFGGLGRVLEGTLVRREKLTVTRCRSCIERERKQNLIGQLGSLVMGVAILAALTVGLNGYASWGIAIMIAAVIGATVFFVVLQRRGKRLPHVVYIHSDRTIAFVNVHAELARRAVENVAPPG